MGPSSSIGLRITKWMKDYNSLSDLSSECQIHLPTSLSSPSTHLASLHRYVIDSSHLLVQIQVIPRIMRENNNSDNLGPVLYNCI